MTELSYAALATAFAAGTVSFLSPCVLPLVPGYLSYIAGQTSIGTGNPAEGLLRIRAVALSFCFVLGFSTVFVVLGASATALGQIFNFYRYQLNLVGGAVVILFGLFTIGVLRPAWLLRDARVEVGFGRGRPAGAYVLGAAFAFGWTPCIGPILGSILTVSAASATIVTGVILLSAYSIGLGVPFVITATFTDTISSRLKAFGGFGRALQFVAGAVMVLIGTAMITDRLSSFSYWLLDAFPVLGQIG
jgi:cytochrome c-type biogenesis protein